MAIITIDGENYTVEALSEEAQGQIASINFVDAEAQRLQAQLAVLQTARVAYVNRLSQIVKEDEAEENQVH